MEIETQEKKPKTITIKRTKQQPKTKTQKVPPKEKDIPEKEAILEEVPPEEEKVQPPSELKLQLGDIIQLTDPTNDIINNQIFLIDYIDQSKMRLINADTLVPTRLSISPKGVLGDGGITHIAILSKAATPSYAVLHDLIPPAWIDIHFGGDLPFVITGEIIGLDHDMIEVRTTDGDIIYINFDYKGLPEDLSIEDITIREPPKEAPEEVPEKAVEKSLKEAPEEAPEEVPEKAVEKSLKEAPEEAPEEEALVEPATMPARIREVIVKANQVHFGDEIFGPIVQYVDVAVQKQRYSIDVQAADMLDDLLSTIPNSQRTPTALNIIHITIERFKQLREKFSLFDQYGNVSGFITKGALYKPLVENYLKTFSTTLYWFLPVVKTIKKVYEVNGIESDDEEDVGVVLMDVSQQENLPMDLPMPGATGVITETAVKTQIVAIVNNLVDMYSTVVINGRLRNRRFITQQYNTADIMAIQSLLTLPEPVIRFSAIALPGTDIMRRANLAHKYFNMWQLLRPNTPVHTVAIEKIDADREYTYGSHIRNYVDASGIEATKFYDIIIPKTRILFNMMKKYISDKLTVVDVVSYLEPFLIYTDDLTYLQYREIARFIDEDISRQNKAFVERSRAFGQLISLQSIPGTFGSNFSLAYPLMKLHSEVLYAFPQSMDHFSNSEMLRQMTMMDYCRLYTAAISLQNITLVFPSEFEQLFEEKKATVAAADACKPMVIAKYYTSLELLKRDDGVVIYFDKKYNKTNEKHRPVINGQYALLYKGYRENAADEVDYYERMGDKWVSAPTPVGINTDDTTILCDLQKGCATPAMAPTDCTNIKEQRIALQTQLMQSILGEFDTKYKKSRDEQQAAAKAIYHNLATIFPLLKYVETNARLKYNAQKYEIGAAGEGKGKKGQLVSPYQPLLDLILGQQDFVKRQGDIVIFCEQFTRRAIEGTIGILGITETAHWRYCTKTDVPLIPTFKYQLAAAYSRGSTAYVNQLRILQSTIGKLSDDGDLWTDQHSGWTICPIDFDTEEGYEESGFKRVTRDILVEATKSSVETSSVIKAKFETPEAQMIVNVISALAISMGINIQASSAFIVNVVLEALQNTMESENEYNVKVRAIAERGTKKIAPPSYKDFYNTALIYYTFGAYLIATQTAIPSIRTRKTFPGCVRSFDGYPFEGAGDQSSLTYLGCVVYEIRDAGEPWNVLKGKKQDFIIGRIKASIDGVLLILPETRRRIEDKTAYLVSTFGASIDKIPEEHALAKWLQFLPPLVPFKINPQMPAAEFDKDLRLDLRSGSKRQHDRILVIRSKIIAFSLGIVERIQTIVGRQRLLLQTATGEPYLENACCEDTTETATIAYFTKKDPRIEDYNHVTQQFSDILDDITHYTKSSMYLSRVNTTNQYPSIDTEWSDRTVYMIFIHYCKFRQLAPIPQELLPFCTDKPSAAIMQSDTPVETAIERLREAGRVYAKEDAQRLLQLTASRTVEGHQLPEQISPFVSFLGREKERDNKFYQLLSAAIDGGAGAGADSKDLNNYLVHHIGEIKGQLTNFVQHNKVVGMTASSLRHMRDTINTVADWKADPVTVIRFYHNAAHNFANVFPTMIVNRVDTTDVKTPKHYKFSENHNRKLAAQISDYYRRLNPLYAKKELLNLLAAMPRECRDWSALINFGTEKLSTRTALLLYEFYLFSIISTYIRLSGEDAMVVNAITKPAAAADLVTAEYLDEEMTEVEITRINQSAILFGSNKKRLQQSTAELLVVMINIMGDQKAITNVSYQDVEDRIFRLKEREKDMVTDRLKDMTDEERDTDTMLKINKLDMYSKGMQKGLTVYDRDYYEGEQKLRNAMVAAERRIRRQNPQANDDNIDLLLDTDIAEHADDAAADEDAYNMNGMGEDWYDGQEPDGDMEDYDMNEYDTA